MKLSITAILSIIVLLAIFSTCGEGGRKVVIHYPHLMGYMNVFKQEGIQKLQVWQHDSLVYSVSRSLAFDISQRVLRVLPDSTAAVEELSTMVLIGPNHKDTTIIDTIKENRAFVLYEAPNGKIVDFESQTPVDSATNAHFRSWYEQACPVFPDSAVGIGSQWTNRTSVTVDSQTLETATSFTVKAFEQMRGYDCIVVDFAGNIILPVRARKTDSVTLGGRDEIRVEGTFWFAFNEGLFVEQSQKEITEGRRDLREKGKEFTRTYRIDGQVRMYLTERKRI